MPVNCIYDPNDQSSSEDLLLRFTKCDVKIQDKNVRNLAPAILKTELQKVANQQIERPTLYVVLAVMPETKNYKMPDGGIEVSCTVHYANVSKEITAGRYYQSSFLDVQLGPNLDVMYLSEDGVRQLLSDFDFEHIRKKGDCLVDVMSPTKQK